MFGLNLTKFFIQQKRFRYQYVRNKPRVKRDILRHQVVPEAQIQNKVLKAIHRDQSLPTQLRLKAMIQMQNMPSYTRENTIKPRCVETGRGNGMMIRDWRISRIVWREEAINGRLAGVRPFTQ